MSGLELLVLVGSHLTRSGALYGGRCILQIPLAEEDMRLSAQHIIERHYRTHPNAEPLPQRREDYEILMGSSLSGRSERLLGSQVTMMSLGVRN
jgi:hypothetical protein